MSDPFKHSNEIPDTMFWYHHVVGKHTIVRVFINGAKCGECTFRNEEFEHIRRESNRSGLIQFRMEELAR